MTRIAADTANVTLSPPSYYNNIVIARAVSITGDNDAVYGATHSWFVYNNGDVRGGTNWGVDLTRGGAVTNNAGGSITGTGGAVLMAGTYDLFNNAGSVASAQGVGVSLQNSGILRNYRGAVISGAAAAVEITSTGSDTIYNQGEISASGKWGVLINGRGYVFNRPGGSIVGSYAGVGDLQANGTVVNGGSIGSADAVQQYGVVLGYGGMVLNDPQASIGGAVDGILVQKQAGSVSNGGTIAGGTSGNGLLLQAGGYVDNSRVGVIEGGTGVSLVYAEGRLSNQGRIVGSNGAAVLIGAGVVTNGSAGVMSGTDGGVVTQGHGALSNLGSIAGGSGYGVDFGQGGSVTNGNRATIGGAGGIFVAYTNGTVMNGGTILGRTGDGIDLTAGGTVVNAGTIGGAARAVYFGGFGPASLVINPSAVFQGSVLAHTTTGSQIRLAGTSEGRLSGLGTQFQGFQSTQVVNGADWQLQGNNTVGALDVIGTLEIAGGTLAATGSLSGGGKLALDAGSLATIDRNSTWAGAIDLTHATISFGGTLFGSGMIDIGAGSTATLAAGSGASVGIDFAGIGGTLDLGNAAHFAGLIGGFAAGDTIGLIGTTADHGSFADGVLKVTEGSATVAQLHFSGSYASNAFQVTSSSAPSTSLTLITLHG